MAQTNYITTAIRELMSPGRPPKSTSPVRLAHIEFIAALAGNVPYPIYANVDSEHLHAFPPRAPIGGASSAALMPAS